MVSSNLFWIGIDWRITITTRGDVISEWRLVLWQKETAYKLTIIQLIADLFIYLFIFNHTSSSEMNESVRETKATEGFAVGNIGQDKVDLFPALIQ